MMPDYYSTIILDVGGTNLDSENPKLYFRCWVEDTGYTDDNQEARNVAKSAFRQVLAALEAIDG